MKTTKRTTIPAGWWAFVVYAALLVSGLPMQGEVVGRHPNFGGSVGLGLDPLHQKDTKPRVAIFDTNEPNSGTGLQTISASFAQHRLDMAKSFSLNSSISLSFGILPGGSVGFAAIDKETFDQDTLTFVEDWRNDFGDVRPDFLGFDTNFVNTVNTLKQTLSGAALHKAITDLYGTHVVYGYKKTTEIQIVYHFKYSSAAVTRKAILDLGGAYSGLDFSAVARRQFTQTNTDVLLDANWASTDTLGTPPFSVFTSITNYSQFLSYTAQVQSYFSNVLSSGAAKSGWLIEPLQSLPGYYSLVGPIAATNLYNADFDSFNHYYSLLRAWEKQLQYWTTDWRHMSWLNTAGQQQVSAMLRDVTNYRKTLEQTASAYFATGAPLSVTDDIVNYFANASRIPVPTIYTLGSTEYSCAAGPHHAYFGYIYFGSTGQTVNQPIGNVSVYENGVDAGTVATSFYSPADFKQYITSLSACGGLRDVIDATFASPIWLSLTNQAATNRIVFFYFDGKPNDVDAGTYSFVITDNAGEVVDSVNMLSTRSAGTLGEVAAAAPEVNLAIGLKSTPVPNIAGLKTTYTLGVTNNGPGAAYGVQLALPLINTNNFDTISLSGSQGQGSFTNGSALFEVGPLANGASATVRVQLVPVMAGAFRPANQADATLGPGLTNPVPSNANTAVGSILLQNPVLSIARAGSQTQLSWQSDTSRIRLEQTSVLQPNANWTTVAGSFATNGSNWKINLNSSGDKKLFRLHGQ